MPNFPTYTSSGLDFYLAPAYRSRLAGVPTAARTYTLPDTSGTFALLSTANTWTNFNTFNSTSSFYANFNFYAGDFYLDPGAGNVFFGKPITVNEQTVSAPIAGRASFGGASGGTAGGTNFVAQFNTSGVRVLAREYRVFARTANTTLVAADDGATITNEGAGGSITLTLPTGYNGLRFTIALVAAQSIVLQMPGGVTAKFAGGLTTTSGGTVTMQAGGVTYNGTLSIVALSSTVWLIETNTATLAYT
jgi:hypothetical protein